MGFSIAYETTEQISPVLQSEIIGRANEMVAERTWLHCEPPFLTDNEGILCGISKVNFTPDRDDAKSVRSDGIPTGTVLDLLDSLCRLSADFDIEWELSHDYSEGPLGYIRCGVADDELRTQCAALADVPDGLPDDDSEFPDD